jgi:hypothetical protein
MGERRKDEMAGTDSDRSLRIGSSHGDATGREELTGYARDIKQEGQGGETGREARTRGSGLTSYARNHPSRNLTARTRGFGIGGGYERPYRKERSKPADSDKELYGPIPHSGYYGSGTGARPFKRGQASFNEEMDWYRSQYGESTSGYGKKK